MNLTTAIQIYKADILAPQPNSTDAHVEILRALQEHPEVLDILAERRRQVEAEGWTPEHDDAHEGSELGKAGVAYAYHALSLGNPVLPFPWMWPWDLDGWKPKDARRNLVKAAALILAEIERLDRAESKAHSGEENHNA